MRVLVGCEFSGVVRDAFRRRGHHAVSCDLLPSDSPHGWHVQGDLLPLLAEPWDLAIFHPPCTHLAVSGARHFAKKRESGVQQEALDFVRALMAAPIPRICIENPISIISSAIRKPDQVVHPHQFGHPEFKATCLWLKGLPKLTPTDALTPPGKGTDEWIAWNRVHRMPPSADRWKKRSVTYAGFAEAMSAQWGGAT